VSTNAASTEDARTVYDQPEDPFIGEVVIFETADGRVGGEVEFAEEIGGDVLVHICERDEPLAWSDIERPETQGSFVCSVCNSPIHVPYICDDCRGGRE